MPIQYKAKIRKPFGGILVNIYDGLQWSGEADTVEELQEAVQRKHPGTDDDFYIFSENDQEAIDAAATALDEMQLRDCSMFEEEYVPDDDDAEMIYHHERLFGPLCSYKTLEAALANLGPNENDDDMLTLLYTPDCRWCAMWGQHGWGVWTTPEDAQRAKDWYFDV